MDLAYPPISHHHELRALVSGSDLKVIGLLRGAACQGMDPETFHPVGDKPDSLTIAQCTGCVARLACLALALRAEDADARSGWYGGVGPADPDDLATALGLLAGEVQPPDNVVRAARLRAEGWVVADIATELGCSRRTVQRYLSSVAA
ncbi:helix-turn-helix domain-containing protein [Amycolatopsis sp. NPDC051061]|uniref:helix-turn-helix domain-containing protein n=1 Tax=Amycolatopsis sp. NPDC051061 TaxID=3155042 RepID=UPI003443936E